MSVLIKKKSASSAKSGKVLIDEIRAARKVYDHWRNKQRAIILRTVKRIPKNERSLYAEKIQKLTKGL